MSKMMVLGLALALSAAAQEGGQRARAAEKPQSAKAAAPAAAAAEAALPQNAEKVRDGVWRAKDPSGKVWIYMKTPFGFSKAEEGALDSKGPTSPIPELKATSVRGDTVGFERETPFGKSKWTKKISELNEDERAAYEKAAPRPEKK